MKNNIIPPGNSLYKGQNKDTKKLTQLKTIFLFLQDNVATASMLSDVTGIPKKNICRYKIDLEKTGRLWEIDKVKCKKTGFNAWYLTTNPDKAPDNSQQINLF